MTNTRLLLGAALAAIMAQAASTAAQAQGIGRGTYSTNAVPLATGAAISTLPLVHYSDQDGGTDVQTLADATITTTGKRQGTQQGAQFIGNAYGQGDTSPFAFTIAGTTTVKFNTAQQYFGAQIQFQLNGQAVDTLTIMNGGTTLFTLNLTSNLGAFSQQRNGIYYYGANFNFDAAAGDTFDTVIISSTTLETDMWHINHATSQQAFAATQASDVAEPMMAGLPIMALTMLGMTGIAVRRRQR